MPDGFTIDELHKLVDQAIHDEVRAPVHGGPDTSLPFAFGDTKLFAILTPLLERYLAPVDVQVFLDELRSELGQGIVRPSLRDLHTIISHCRRCPEMTPEPQLPVGNLIDPDIVFVHELPFAKMLVDHTFMGLLKDSSIPEGRVLHTSIVRCEPLTVRALSNTEVETCVGSYLYNEIATLQPKLIMPLGSIATTALLGSHESMARDRGKVFWLGPWAILPTYSPGYAYRRADAKEALAADLHLAFKYCYAESHTPEVSIDTN